MNGRFVFLGTGGSAGVPIVGCTCPVCTSPSPYNQRLRPSGWIEWGERRILLDVGPDFRLQALREKIDRLDGLLLTHIHYDHIAGIDELRIFFLRQSKPVPCLLSRESYEEMKRRYDYLFHPPGKVGLSAQLDWRVLPQDAGEVIFMGMPIRYFSFFQGRIKVCGFRLGDLAYVSDIRKFDASIFEHLQGVRTLILSALRPEKTQFHLSFEEAQMFAKKVGAQKTWLTHLSHFIDHEEGNQLLSEGVELAYDGLTLEFSCPETL